MSGNSSNFTITNEQLLLINILNTMYNDNVRQINHHAESINYLNQTNTQIRNLLVQILTNQTLNNQNRRRNSNFRPNNANNNRENNYIHQDNQRGLGRITLNNTPYIIDSIYEYTIPINQNSRINSNNSTNNSLNNTFSRILQNFLEPIDVFPTQSQIETATRRVRYGDIISPINRSCPISLENFNDDDLVSVIRYCGHLFNTTELNTWFRSNCRCPVCRYDIRNYNNNISSENFLNQPTNTDSTSQRESLNENINSETSEERNSSEINYNNSTIPSNYINNFVDNILNDFNFNNIDNFVTDISNNNINTSAELFNIFNRLNNTNQRRNI